MEGIPKTGYCNMPQQQEQDKMGEYRNTAEEQTLTYKFKNFSCPNDRHSAGSLVAGTYHSSISPSISMAINH